MQKKSKTSFLPKRSSSAMRDAGRDARSGQFTIVHRDVKHSILLESGNVGRSVLGKIDLPNGQSIKTVRKDIFDSGLNRGEFKRRESTKSTDDRG